MRTRKFFIWAGILAIVLVGGCSKPPSRQYFMLNYMPPEMAQRAMQNPYACVIRLRDFSIEEAYNRSQIVYRLNPFELRYYNYKSWAVKPTRMITDLFFKHLNSIQIASSVVRRLDEAGRRPDFEISGFIEALEEYDSDDMLFAHIALRVNMTRLSDGSTVYSRHFDLRKRVYNRGTEFVVKELSQIIEHIFSEAIADIDQRLAAEYGITDFEVPAIIPIEEPTFTSDINDGDE
jgi:ABC-type uncharacterized transport system auxiliary subunit